jgi:hypothetical protein
LEVKIKVMRTKELEEIVAEKYNKYNELLWYARKQPEDLLVDSIAKQMKKVEWNSPEEVSELQGENSDWQHGFHSGCNAAFSYILSCLNKREGLETANNFFPDLDS